MRSTYWRVLARIAASVAVVFASDTVSAAVITSGIGLSNITATISGISSYSGCSAIDVGSSTNSAAPGSGAAGTAGAYACSIVDAGLIVTNEQIASFLSYELPPHDSVEFTDFAGDSSMRTISLGVVQVTGAVSLSVMAEAYYSLSTDGVLPSGTDIRPAFQSADASSGIYLFLKSLDDPLNDSMASWFDGKSIKTCNALYDEKYSPAVCDPAGFYAGANDLAVEVAATGTYVATEGAPTSVGTYRATLVYYTSATVGMGVLPEPGTLALVGLALVGAISVQRARRQKPRDTVGCRTNASGI